MKNEYSPTQDIKNREVIPYNPFQTFIHVSLCPAGGVPRFLKYSSSRCLYFCFIVYLDILKAYNYSYIQLCVVISLSVLVFVLFPFFLSVGRREGRNLFQSTHFFLELRVRLGWGWGRQPDRYQGVPHILFRVTPIRRATL